MYTEHDETWTLCAALSLRSQFYHSSRLPMPTEQSTQGSDAANAAHQSQTDNQNAKAHSDTSSEFDARKAFDAANKRFNDFQAEVTSKLEKFDPVVITQIAEKLGVSKEKAEEKVEKNDPSVQEVARQIAREEMWNKENAERLEDANKNGKYDEYIKFGYQRDHALRLAEQDEGIVIDTSGQDRQRKVSAADATVDRGTTKAMPDSLRGIMTPEDYEKIAQDAQKVQIVR